MVWASLTVKIRERAARERGASWPQGVYEGLLVGYASARRTKCKPRHARLLQIGTLSAETQ